jgi:hypothetical protein
LKNEKEYVKVRDKLKRLKNIISKVVIYLHNVIEIKKTEDSNEQPSCSQNGE